MPVEVRMKEDAATVTLAGEMGLQEARELKSALAEAVEHAGGVQLDISELSGMDVSVLQLMHAVRCHCRGQARRVTRVSRMQATVAQIAADAGAAGVGCGRICGEPQCVFEER